MLIAFWKRAPHNIYEEYIYIFIYIYIYIYKCIASVCVCVIILVYFTVASQTRIHIRKPGVGMVIVSGSLDAVMVTPEWQTKVGSNPALSCECYISNCHHPSDPANDAGSAAVSFPMVIWALDKTGWPNKLSVRLSLWNIGGFEAHRFEHGSKQNT